LYTTVYAREEGEEEEGEEKEKEKKKKEEKKWYKVKKKVKKVKKKVKKKVEKLKKNVFTPPFSVSGVEEVQKRRSSYMIKIIQFMTKTNLTK
jgi:hypothetical protein